MDSVTRCPVNKGAKDGHDCNSCRFFDTPTIMIRYKGMGTEMLSEPCRSCCGANPNVHADYWMPMVRPKSVTDIISEVVTEICDYYCKYPEQYKDYDDMLKEQCEQCPLNKLT